MLDVGHILTCMKTTGVDSAGSLPGMDQIPSVRGRLGSRCIGHAITHSNGECYNLLTVLLLSVQQRISSLTGGHYDAAADACITVY